MRQWIARASIIALVAATACGGGAAQSERIDQVLGGSGVAGVPGAGEAGGSSLPDAAGDPYAAEDAASGLGTGPAAGDDDSAAATPASAGSGRAAPRGSSPRSSAGRPAGGSAAGRNQAASPAPGSGGARTDAGAASEGGAGGGDAVPEAPKVVPPAGNPDSPDVGITAKSIKVGHVGIYSGPVGEFGQDLSEAGLAALQYWNDNGGVNGRKLNIVIEDDSWEAAKGLAKVRKLVEQDQVFALVASQSVPTTNAAAPYLDEKKVPHVGTDGWGEPQYNAEYTFPTGVSTVTEARMMARYDAERGVKRAGILYLNNADGQQYADTYAAEIAKHGGEVVARQAANFDDAGTTSFLLQCRSNDCEKINVWSDPGVYVRMVLEASQQRYKPEHGFGGANGIYFAATPEMAGSWSEGTVATTYYWPNDIAEPGLKRYMDIVGHYYEGVQHTGWTKAGFVGANLFVDALKRLGRGQETRENLKNELNGLRGWDTGLGLPLSFTPTNHRSNAKVWVVRLEGGQWKTVEGPLEDDVVGAAG